MKTHDSRSAQSPRPLAVPSKPGQRCLRLALIALTLNLFSAVESRLNHCLAQGSVFTYQGRLDHLGTPANGSFDLTFTLWTAPAGPAQIGATLTNLGMVVSNGLVTATLDFGENAFDGSERWLEIGVRDGGGAFTLLTPRQGITSTPYAVRAARFSGDVADSQLSPNIARLDGYQTFTGMVSFSHPSNSFTGVFSGSGSGITNVPGTLAFETVEASLIQAQPATSYQVTGPDAVTFALPTDALIGDVIQLQGVSSAGWVVNPGSGEIIQGYEAGVLWIPRESNRDWRALASSTNGLKLVAVVQGGQIYTSSDGGTNWMPRESNRNWQAVASSADGSRLIAAVEGGQLYTSTDSGLNWFPRESNRQWSAVASSADGTKLVATVRDGQIFTSIDSGANWIARATNRAWNAVASSADGTRLIAADQGPVLGSGGQLYVSADGGTNWVARESNRVWSSVTSSHDGSRLAAAVNGWFNSCCGQIFVSTDHGTNWSPRESSRSWSSIASSPDGMKLIATVLSGQIYTSRDGGTNWTARDGNRGWRSAALSSDAERLVAAASSGRIYTSTPLRPSGGQGESLTLHYAGNGIWQPINTPNRVVGSVIVQDAQIFSIEAERLQLGLNSSAIGSNSIAFGTGVTASGTNATAMGVSTMASGLRSTAVGYKTLASGDASTALGYRTTASGRAATAIGFGTVATGFGSAAIGGGPFSVDINTGDRIPSGSSLAGADSAVALGYASTAAGDYSLAAGHRAKANHAGSFVWADSQNTDFTSTGTNQFLIRASGGVGIGITNPANRLHVAGLGAYLDNGAAGIVLENTAPGTARRWQWHVMNDGRMQFVDFDAGLTRLLIDTNGQVGINTGPSADLHVRGIGTNGNIVITPNTSNARSQLLLAENSSATLGFILRYAGDEGSNPFHLIPLNAGTEGSPMLTVERNGGFVGIGTNNPVERLHVVGNILATGTITPSSDRNMKKNLAPVNESEILQRLLALPLAEWTYRSETDDVRHLGPVAQDFRAAFGLGSGDTTIATVDADGVAFAAIQGLHRNMAEELKRRDAENGRLKRELQEVRETLETLEKRLRTMEQNVKAER